jgi:phosphoenolpyruvate-protein kinase (PTS system EI component)
MLRGVGASPGVAVGIADCGLRIADGLRLAEGGDAASVLEATAARFDELAAAAPGAEAEILSASAMMARDPALLAAVEAELADDNPLGQALIDATEGFAQQLEAIDDPTLSARAEDVRSIGRRAANPQSANRNPPASRNPQSAIPVVVIARDLGPADVAELPKETVAIALSQGAVTAHAAIVARARGIPMVVGLGDEALRAEGRVIVDGDTGEVLTHPSPERVRAAEAAMAARASEHARARADRGLPAVTRDGRALRVLCNAASAAEVGAGLEAGADGAGLIRTELAFLEAPEWPAEAQHAAALRPVLEPLAGRLATVRVLDFGGDKTPPFLAGTSERGLALLLGAAEAFGAQLRAILATAAETRCDLRVLLPMVRSAGELAAARELVEWVAGQSHLPVPAVGAMIETPGAAAAAIDLTSDADFLSIGTNDLTHATLGSDRFAAVDAPTQDPAVLRNIDLSVRAAHAAGLPIEVCGEAASDPDMLPLLVGLDVDELSVGAARVGATRAWVRDLAFSDCRERARLALAEGVTATR